MEISVRQASIKPKFIKHLINNDVLLLSHLNTFDAKTLAERVKLKLEECEEILNAVKPKRPHYIMRAQELMIKPVEKVSTLIKELDEILGGGIPCGSLIEISGQAGVGKSNFCAQIGLLVMMPRSQGGLDGDVLLIHTEGEGKLKLCIKRFQTLASSVGREDLISIRLNVMNCASEFELSEIINRLPDCIEGKSDVKLIIIDSMTSAFISEDKNSGFEFYDKRAHMLTKMVKILAQLAFEKNIAIVITNHVSFIAREGETRPAMGKKWSHMCHKRIFMKLHRGKRIATVTKGALKSQGCKDISFVITNNLVDQDD